MKTKIFAVVLLLFVCLLFNNAFADPPVNTISVNTDTLDTHFIDYLKNKILQLGDTIADKALTLLLSLAIINIFIVGMKLLFKGANFNEFLLEMVKLIMVFGFFIFVIDQGPKTFIDASQSFIGIAKNCTGTSCANDLSDFVFKLMQHAGVFIAQAMFATQVEVGWDGVNIIEPLLISCITIMIALIIIAIATNMIITVVKSWFVLTAGIFAVGFGGLSFTNQYAMNYLKGFVSLGFQIMAIAFIGEVVIEICSSLSKELGYNPECGLVDCSFQSKKITIIQALNILCLFLILFLISGSVPKAIADMMQNGNITPSALTTINLANMMADTSKAAAKDMSQTRNDFKNIAHMFSRPTEGQNTDITVGSEGTKSGTSDNNPIRDRTRNL